MWSYYVEFTAESVENVMCAHTEISLNYFPFLNTLAELHV